VLFLCVYRPSFTLFDGQNAEIPDQAYQEIRLQELSASDAQAMLKSLLKSEDIPAELTDFVGNKAEGNPFYLEEVVNSLIESEILTQLSGLAERSLKV
jgi:predicted ATPase